MRTLDGFRRTGRAFLAAGLVLAAASCSEGKDPIGTDRDEVALLVLETPGTDEGAVMFVIEGPAPVGIEAISASHTLFSRQLPAGGTRVVVIGNLSEGAVLTLNLAEGGVDEYEATLTQVADRQNALRTNLAGYSLAVQGLGD